MVLHPLHEERFLADPVVSFEDQRRVLVKRAILSKPFLDLEKVAVKP